MSDTLAISPFVIDTKNSDEDYLYVDIPSHHASIAIKRESAGVVVDIYRLRVSEGHVATACAKTDDLLRRRFQVRLEARAIYEIEIDACDESEAELKAETIWTDSGPDNFEFQDFMDVHVEAEEVEP